MLKLAFYLPQYHPIAENDEWWGKGFTEWRNVTLSTPRFKGHRQPQIPADFGFYDLRVLSVMEDQAKLARKTGFDGFCVYHYWFHGRRILEGPIESVLSNSGLDFPFVLCWANESWSRSWDGLEHQLLIKQEYSDKDDQEHAEYLVRVFSDDRYRKIDGRPVFVVYRPKSHPNLEQFKSKLNLAAVAAGFPGVYLMGCSSGFSSVDLPGSLDAVVDFQPNRSDFPVAEGFVQKCIRVSKKFLPDFCYQYVKRNASVVQSVNYDKMVSVVLGKYDISYNMCPCVFPSWDNSPRRKTPTVIQNDDPGRYGDWLKAAMDVGHSNGAPAIFVNAWNEWAEGCHLEPDVKFKHEFLAVTRDVLTRFGGSSAGR